MWTGIEMVKVVLLLAKTVKIEEKREHYGTISQLKYMGENEF